MHYLTVWRMHLARQAHNSGHRDMERLARDPGYLSTAAFQKAVKRVHRVMPTRG
jgi:AraC-like DNA-binding protein